MGILGELWVKLGLKSDDFKKGTQDAKKQVSGLTNYLQKLGGMITAAFSVKAVVQFTHQAAELSNKVKGVRAAFEKLGDPTLLNNLRKATQGTVDDLQLMQRAIQAKNFGIPVKNLATYLEFATKRASETGQSVDYLVDSIITGLGRQSVLILDNLGFSAAEIRDRMKEGGTMADAVGAMIKKSMGEGAAEIDKAALATQRLSTAWTNFSIAFGESSAPVWNKLKTMGAELFEGVTKVLNAEGFSGRDKFSLLFGGVFGTDRYYKNWAKLNLQEQQKEIEAQKQAEINAAKQAEEAAKAEAEAKRQAAIEEAKRKSQIISYLESEIEKTEQLRKEATSQEDIMKYNEELAKMREKLKLIQMTTEELKKYRREQSAPIANVNDPFENRDFGKERTDKFQQEMQSRYNAYIEAGANARKKVGEQLEQIKQLNEMFNQSIVSGISGGIQSLVQAMMNVEGMNFGSVIQALLTPMADALAKAGEMIIAEGVAVEAFKESLKTLNGFAAIVAGGTLVAIASAVKAGLASLGNNPTSGGAYGTSSMTSYSGGYGVNTNNYAQEANSYTLTTTLKGQDLLLAIQRTENNNRR